MLSKMIKLRTLRVGIAGLIAITMIIAMMFPSGTSLFAYAEDDVDEIIILKGGESLTTSATGTGTDPNHTEVIYQLAENAEGVISFIPDPHNNAITIMGNPAGTPNNVSINIAKGINLTIKDVNLVNTDGLSPINFNGVLANSNLLSNQLMLEGVNVIKQYNPEGVNAAVRVHENVQLEIVGNGMLYLDKNTAGAGIGGNGVLSEDETPEKSGEITISSGDIFLSGSGSGAGIGVGGGGLPAEEGKIAITGGNINVATNSAAAAIGGSANSGAGIIELTGGNLTVTTNAKGPAIGKGGDAAEDAPNGSIKVLGGSLKAIAGEGAGAYWPVSVGATNDVITADIIDSSDALSGSFVFDTLSLEDEDDYFRVLLDNKLFYEGGLHSTVFNNSSPNNPVDNWSTLSGSNIDHDLYFNLPKTSTRISINGEGFDLTWNELQDKFDVTEGEPDDGSIWNGSVDTSWYNTQDSSFTIETPAQLAGVAHIVNGTAKDGIQKDDFTGKTIEILDDIDLNNFPWTTIGTGVTTIDFTYTNPNNGFTDKSLTNVIESVSSPFNGTFNANNNTIKGFRVNSTAGLQGLFGYVGSNGAVKNLKIEGSIRTTTPKDAVGGLIGFNRGLVSHCTVNVEVIAVSTYNVGGIAGFNDGRTGNAVIEYSSNLGRVHGYSKVGGIVGQNAGLIKNSYNTGRVDGTNASSKNGVGGIAGRNGNNNIAVEVGQIINCFAICDLGREGGQKWVGGIVGFQNSISSVENCYFAGDFPSWNGNTNNPIVGYTDFPTLANEYNINNYTLDRINYSGWEESEHGIAITEEEMKSSDFISMINGAEGVGRAYLQDFQGNDAVNNGYPILRGVHVPDNGELIGLKILKAPTKLEYNEGEYFDARGFVAVAEYRIDDGDGNPDNDEITSEKITNIEASITDRYLTTSDTQITLTAKFGGMSVSASYDIEVLRDDLVSIHMSKEPRGNIFAHGERFDIYTGLEITATFESGAQRVLGGEEFTWDPATLYAGDTKVTISYSFNDIVKEVDVPVIVLDAARPQWDEDFNYIISSPEHLVWFMARVNQNYNTEYSAVLTEDLDMTDTILQPIGGSIYFDEYYQGTFDGKGHSITLNYDDSEKSNVGLFSTIGYAGVVKNLTIKGNIKAKTYAGAIAGTNYGEIINCTNSAIIEGSNSDATAQVHIGGITGSLHGTVKDSSNTADLSARNYLGGIAGAIYGEGEIINSNNSGNITGELALVGGIVGNANSTAVVAKSNNSGDVKGGYYVGGIVGDHKGTGVFSELRNDGNVTSTATSITATYATAGVVGRIAAGGTLEKSMNAGNITGTNISTGGVVGYVEESGKIISCYNGGEVTGLMPRNNTAVGGVIGAINRNSSTVTGCYNTGNTKHALASGEPDSYTTIIGPVVGNFKPTSSINDSLVNNNYYSADSVLEGTEVVIGEVVTLSNQNAVKALLEGITPERIVVTNGDYPLPISLYKGGISNGDMNCDGSFDILDIIELLGAIMGGSLATNEGMIAADMDEDGSLTITDIIEIMIKFMGN